jgi:hypothetical protein
MRLHQLITSVGFWAHWSRSDRYLATPGGHGIHMDSRNFSPILSPLHNQGHGTGAVDSISRFLVHAIQRDDGKNFGLATSCCWPYRLDPE